MAKSDKPLVSGIFTFMEKKCKSCNEIKSIKSFEYCKGGIYNVAGTCKKCKKENSGFCINDILDLDGEIWVDIINWEGLYSVSNKSRIKRLPRVFADKTGRLQNLREKILKTPECTTSGYNMIYLEANGMLLKTTVHRIVAQHFIPNPENKPEVNHKNGIRNDNRLDNLEWCTTSENIKHSFSVLGRKPSMSMLGKTGKLHPSSKRVNQIDIISGCIINTFDSMTLAIQSGNATDKKNLSLCCMGINKKHNNFKWEYA